MAKTVRWVQYEAAVFVRVESDDGWDAEVTKVVTANDVDELQLARDHRGRFRVYDENFEPVTTICGLTVSGVRCRSPRIGTVGLVSGIPPGTTVRIPGGIPICTPMTRTGWTMRATKTTIWSR